MGDQCEYELAMDEVSEWNIMNITMSCLPSTRSSPSIESIRLAAWIEVQPPADRRKKITGHVTKISMHISSQNHSECYVACRKMSDTFLQGSKFLARIWTNRLACHFLDCWFCWWQKISWCSPPLSSSENPKIGEAHCKVTKMGLWIWPAPWFF